MYVKHFWEMMDWISECTRTFVTIKFHAGTFCHPVLKLQLNLFAKCATLQICTTRCWHCRLAISLACLGLLIFQWYWQREHGRQPQSNNRKPVNSSQKDEQRQLDGSWQDTLWKHPSSESAGTLGVTAVPPTLVRPQLLPSEIFGQRCGKFGVKCRGFRRGRGRSHHPAGVLTTTYNFIFLPTCLSTLS